MEKEGREGMALGERRLRGGGTTISIRCITCGWTAWVSLLWAGPTNEAEETIFTTVHPVSVCLQTFHGMSEFLCVRLWLLFDSRVFLCNFLQTSILNSADKRTRMRITMATATAPPIMNTLLTPGAGGGGGERDTLQCTFTPQAHESQPKDHPVLHDQQRYRHGVTCMTRIVQLTNYQEVLVDDSTPTSVGCSAGVVPTVASLHRGDGEDVVCHCDSVTTSDRWPINFYQHSVNRRVGSTRCAVQSEGSSNHQLSVLEWRGVGILRRIWKEKRKAVYSGGSTHMCTCPWTCVHVHTCVIYGRVYSMWVWMVVYI